MEDLANLIKSLLEKAAEYAKTSLELVKLKALDKILDVVSSCISYSIVFVIIALFMLFLSLGLGFWLGEILGKTYLGFFVVAALYGMMGIIVRLFINKWIKKIVGNYIIKRLFK